MQGISKADDCKKERIHEKFDLSYIIGHGTYRDQIRILYPDLDLSCLPPLEKNTNELLMEIGTTSSKARMD